MQANILLLKINYLRKPWHDFQQIIKLGLNYILHKAMIFQRWSIITSKNNIKLKKIKRTNFNILSSIHVKNLKNVKCKAEAAVK